MSHAPDNPAEATLETGSNRQVTARLRILLIFFVLIILLNVLKPGFRLLVDLTGLQAMEVSCAPHIRNILDVFNQNGVAEVLRVIPDPRQDIGLQTMSYFHYDSEVRVVTYPNVDEVWE